ncbi:MAG: hypothetical protein OXC26_19450 [Albidovulum sp.]|nr:hypothetical protein [Albidovulum sp.]
MSLEPHAFALAGVWDLAEALYNEASWKPQSTPADADTLIAWKYLPASKCPPPQNVSAGKRIMLAMVGEAGGALEGFRIYQVPISSRLKHTLRIEDNRGKSFRGIEWHRDVLEKPHASKHAIKDAGRSNERWLTAIWTLSGRIHAVERWMEKTANGVWQWVDEAFLDPYGQDYEPTMEVLVEHARTLHPVLADLSASPRKVLRRVHRTVPVGAATEMDDRTLRWLLKQPGRDTAERAGTRQTILAPVREENLDTLENRTLRTVAEMSTRLVGEYVVRDPKKRELLAAYRRRCRTLDRDLRLRGVRTVQPGVSPNYVLQHDARYQTVWAAWQALIRHDRARDLVWIWQSRSWDEFCFLFALVACRMQTQLMTPLAEMPLQARNEQREGRWIALHEPAMVFFPVKGGHQWTIEVHSPMMDSDQGRLPGTAASLHVKSWNGRTFGRMPIYALHSFRKATEDEDLAGLERTCDLIERKEKSLGKVYGVALRSVFDRSGSEPESTRRDARLMRAAFEPGSELTKPMDHFGEHIEAWLQDAIP